MISETISETDTVSEIVSDSPVVVWAPRARTTIHIHRPGPEKNPAEQVHIDKNPLGVNIPGLRTQESQHDENTPGLRTQESQHGVKGGVI